MRIDTVAALFVETGGCYFGLDGVDPWDQARDARFYRGPYPIVAHPPCQRWCQMAPVNQARYGHKIGDDGGIFESALRALILCGGVIEHPAFSLAWKAFDLPRPDASGCWIRQSGFSIAHVEQGHYGHPCRKATWLLAHEPVRLPELIRGKSKSVGWISTDRPRHELAAMGIRHIQRKEARATPLPFRDLLLSMARTR